MIRTFKTFHVAALVIDNNFQVQVVAQTDVTAGHLTKTDAKKALLALNMPLPSNAEIRFQETGSVTYEMDDATYIANARMVEAAAE